MKRFVADAGENQLHGRETGEMNVYFSLSTVTTVTVKKNHFTQPGKRKKKVVVYVLFFLLHHSLFSPQKNPLQFCFSLTARFISLAV